MDKITFDINQFFRYLLSGGWALVCYYFIKGKNPETFSKEIGLILIFLAIIIGAVIYVTYRTILYPLIYKRVYRYHSKRGRVERDPQLSWSVFNSPIEIEDNFRRWKERNKKDSYTSRDIILWGSQVHFLFCAGLASLYSAIYSIIFDNWHCRDLYILALSLILVVCGFISSINLTRHDFRSIHRDFSGGRL